MNWTFCGDVWFIFEKDYPHVSFDSILENKFRTYVTFFIYFSDLTAIVKMRTNMVHLLEIECFSY